VRFCFCAAVIVQLTACATALKTGVEPIAVDSRPSGADAVIECAHEIQASAVTPARIRIPRRAEACVLTISKAGHTSTKIPLERGLNALYWSNFSVLPGLYLGP